MLPWIWEEKRMKLKGLCVLDVFTSVADVTLTQPLGSLLR